MSELLKDDNMMADEDITVIKRNGDHVSYNRCKIRDAVLKAYNEKYPNDEKNSVKALTISWFADTVIKYHPKTKETKSISVEDIQDIVEEILTTRDYKVGRAYIRYRHKRETARNTTDESILELIRGESEYWQTENSNKDADNVTTQRDYIAGITSKDITRRFLLPSDVLNADEQGIIHFHDSDYFIQPISNCSLPNLGDMLQYGTVINKKMIEKPHRVLTCSTISTQIITAVASSQYGGTTINLSDMAPFVRSSYEIYLNKYKDYNLPDDICESLAKKDLAKEVEDAVQTFNYQINSMSTTNGQTPFISVFMHINDNPEYAEETAMLIHEFIKQRIQGMKNEEGVWVTQEFPKLLYVLEEDNIRPDSKYYYITELAAECNIKRLAPDYISKKKLQELKSGDVYGCMGCRSFLTVDRFSDKLGNIAHAKNYVEGKHKYWGRLTNVVKPSLNDVNARKSGVGEFLLTVKPKSILDMAIPC